MEKKLFLKAQKGHLRIGHLSKICFLAIFAALLITGCTKKEVNLQEDLLVVNDITFHDGRLFFKDDSTFKNHQQWLFENQNNTQLIVDKNKSLGLKSMTEYYLEGMKLDEADPKFSEYVSTYPSVFYKEACDSSTLYLLPHSKILCYVANKDGIFQVGDQIYRITENYIYQTADESKIEMLFLPKDQISSKDVKVMPSTTRLEAKTDYGNRTENFYNDNRFRIVSSVRTYMNGPLRYYDICTNPQKRNWTGIYLRASLNTKSANSNGYFNVNNCPLCPPGSITPSPSEETGFTLIAIAKLDPIYKIDMNNSSCPAYSRGRLIDGTVEYIYISWANALVNSPSANVTHTDILNDPY